MNHMTGPPFVEGRRTDSKTLIGVLHHHLRPVSIVDLLSPDFPFLCSVLPVIHLNDDKRSEEEEDRGAGLEIRW
jgi:hypothetical protein